MMIIAGRVNRIPVISSLKACFFKALVFLVEMSVLLVSIAPQDLFMFWLFIRIASNQQFYLIIARKKSLPLQPLAATFSLIYSTLSKGRIPALNQENYLQSTKSLTHPIARCLPSFGQRLKAVIADRLEADQLA